MKFASYRSTPGLELYAESERFHTWRAAHKRLLKEDVEYRQTCNRFIMAILCLAVAISGGGILGGIMSRNFGVLLEVVLLLLPAVAITPVIVWLSFRQQAYMNERIGRLLQSHH